MLQMRWAVHTETVIQSATANEGENVLTDCDPRSIGGRVPAARDQPATTRNVWVAVTVLPSSANAVAVMVKSWPATSGLVGST